MATTRHGDPRLPHDYIRLDGSERRPAPGATRLGPADAGETFSVTIALRRRSDGPPLPDFDHFLQTPPTQRQRMAQDEFAAKYGAHPDDIAAVEAFARSHQLSIVKSHAARRTVVVSGTVAQMSQAFQVELGRYRRLHSPRRRRAPRPETYRGRDGYIHIPKALAGVVVGVFGLDNRSVSRSNGSTGDPPIINPVSVPQIAALYNFPPPGSAIAQQTIGIISLFGGFGGYLPSDLDQFFTPLGLSPTVVPVSVDGAANGAFKVATTSLAPAGTGSLTIPLTPGIQVGSFVNPIPQLANGGVVTQVASTATSTTLSLDMFDNATQSYDLPASFTADVPPGTTLYINLDGETTQDICISAAAAPGANVAVYFAADDQAGWVDLIGRALHPEPGDFPAGVNPPSVLSSSFYIAGGDDPDGLAVYGITAGVMQAISAAFQDAALQGVTVCIASGDFGSNSDIGQYAPSQGDGYAHVGYPGSDPWVLSVGGTALGQYTPMGSSQPQWVEFAWNDWNIPTANPSYPWGTTGGGVSDFFPLPSYQIGANVPGSINTGYTPPAGTVSMTPPAPFKATGRGVPDVAGNASYNSGYAGIVLGDGPFVGNGTSGSTPLWAGLIATLNANLGYSVGFINPMLYALGTGVFNPLNPLWPDPAYPQLANCPTDNGNNGIPGYPTRAGWDACTGWGSPDGAKILNALKQQFGQDCTIIVDQPVFGLAAVQDELAQSPTAVFKQVFFVLVDGYTPAQLGITPNTLSNPTVKPTFAAPPGGIAFQFASVQPADAALLASNANAPQRFTYVYDVAFTATSAFPNSPTGTAPVAIDATLSALVNNVSVPVSASASLTLEATPAPHFAGGSGLGWLSSDVRVFQVEPGGEWTLPWPGHLPLATGAVLNNTGTPSVDATGFIQQVIHQFNVWSAAQHPFDLIPTDENAAELDVLPVDPATMKPVYNFAVARVRYDPTTVNAQSVRAFFRLIPAMSTSTAYDRTTTYRRWSDGIEYGQAAPLLGIDPSTGDVTAIPCFATPRIDATQASLATQTDPPNVQPIAGNATSEVDTYFGCWLDLNQTGTAYPANLSQLPASVALNNPDGPFAAASLQPIQTLIANIHQCLVAEIAFDPDPIPQGFTPSTTGPLAQRNLSIQPAANPGHPGSRRVPNGFMVRPTPAALATGKRADELMIDWGATPAGSIATIYWPSVNAATVLELADRMYTTHNWTMVDSHTLQTTVGGIGYLPIPPGTGSSVAGLITIDLPLGIRKGQVFNTVVRQVTAATTPRRIDVALPTRRPSRVPSAKRVLGAFQITVRVEHKETMLAPAEHQLAVLRWIEQSTPASSPWFAVVRRSVEHAAERVQGLGGHPARIHASPTGHVRELATVRG